MRHNIRQSETLSIMLSVLSDTQRAIVEVMTMRLLAPQALKYLKNAGHEMSRSKYSEDS